jgi:flagellar protein FlaJ
VAADGGVAAQNPMADGETSTAKRVDATSQSIFNLGLVENYVGEYSVFDRIKSREGNYEAMQILKSPHLFFRDFPVATLALTVPATVTLLAFFAFSGLAPLSLDAFKSAPVRGTFFWLYIPLYLIALPLSVFYEWDVRTRKSIIGNLSENLRKLSSANDTGMTLLDSIKIVADTSSGRLADEFETIHRKVNYGTNLREALLEFNNKYHIPRLARTVKLISKAQETSSEITEVLTTAAQASENQDDIERDRKSRTRMQMVIIIMTFITLLGVMAILKIKFLDVMAGLASQAGGGGGGSSGSTGFAGGVDTDLLTMLFFHAVALQGIMSGLIAGYIREVSIMSGLKFVVVLPTIALLVFLFI